MSDAPVPTEPKTEPKTQTPAQPTPPPMPPPATPRAKRPKSALRRRSMSLLRIAIGVYLLWCAALYIMQDDLVFPRSHTRRVLPDDQIPPEVEHWWLDTTDDKARAVRVEAYFIPSPRVPVVRGEKPSTNAPLLVYFHGNDDTLDRCADSVRPWRERGFNVLVPEYRGYGRSTGVPSQEAIVRDCVAFVDRALERPEVDRTRVVYHGWSLGSAVASQVALQRTPRVVIVQAGFSSISAFAWSYGVPPFLVKNPFRSDEALASLMAASAGVSGTGVSGNAAPPRVLLMHSRDDEIVPWSHAERLRRAVPDAGFFELFGSHILDIDKNEAAWTWIDGQLREVGMKVENEND